MKKPVIIILAAVIVVAAIVVSLIFALGGSENEQKPQLLDVSGEWTVVAQYNNDVPTFVENQRMTFADGKAAMYKDGGAEPYAQSGYVVNEANRLILADISREYKIDKKTDNCIRLYENTATYMLLIKKGTASDSALNNEAVVGKWNVTMKGDRFNNGEVLEFSATDMKYYKAGAAEPFATSVFTLSADGVISMDNLGLTMRCLKISDNTVMFVEQSGIVWELTKQ